MNARRHLEQWELKHVMGKKRTTNVIITGQLIGIVSSTHDDWEEWKHTLQKNTKYLDNDDKEFTFAPQIINSKITLIKIRLRMGMLAGDMMIHCHLG